MASSALIVHEAVTSRPSSRTRSGARPLPLGCRSTVHRVKLGREVHAEKARFRPRGRHRDPPVPGRQRRHGERQRAHFRVPPQPHRHLPIGARATVAARPSTRPARPRNKPLHLAAGSFEIADWMDICRRECPSACVPGQPPRPGSRLPAGRPPPSACARAVVERGESVSAQRHVVARVLHALAGLVLPGPALAPHGHEFGESRVRRYSPRPPRPSDAARQGQAKTITTIR